jgi:hypothetical protein
MLGAGGGSCLLVEAPERLFARTGRVGRQDAAIVMFPPFLNMAGEPHVPCNQS